FTFGFRNIPINQFVSIEDVIVGDESGWYTESRSEAPGTYYVDRDSGEYVIYWFYPPTRDATRVFTVEYTVTGGLIINEEVGDRFFWKAVGPDHDFPIESSTVIVHMPPGATVDTSIEPAFFGVDATYTISDDLTTVTFQAFNIPADQEFEGGVRFPHGFVPNVKPPWQEAYEREQAWNETWRPILNLLGFGLGLLLLVGGLMGVYFLWLFAGRDPRVGSVPEYLTEPPSDLPPGLAGTLVDEKADTQDIIATLLDLARRGAIVMEEREGEVFGLSSLASRGFVFHREKDFAGPLRSYEKLLLSKMFGRRDQVGLDDLRNKFYRHIPVLQKALYEEAVKEGLFPASPKAVRGRYLGLGIAGLVLSMGVGFCAAAGFADRVQTILCPFTSLAVISLALIVVSRVMPTKTRKGAEEAAKWRAFKTYLRNAERYTDLEQATDLFDRYLPYAVAFGLERAWVKKFSRIPTTPVPRWYIPVGMPYHPYHRRVSSGGGPGGGLAPDLRDQRVRPAPSLDGMSDRMFGGLESVSSGLFTMLNSTTRAMTSVPRSSSSGGFSGGGFSGGGFSGGGGGGGGGAGFG
ncbi:MAG TPA: DUF2207 domain-containing protein, partial [Chloroflexi bacterium]|nr:DUF2207 domain-containing protein [Chloroflexota bacterium]